MGHRLDRSPLLARTYASYARHQLDMLEQLIGEYRPSSILDPMAGVGTGLVGVATGASDKASRLFLEDVNPVTVALSRLWMPEIHEHWPEFTRELAEAVDEVWQDGSRQELIASESAVTEVVASGIAGVLQAMRLRPGWQERVDPGSKRSLSLACLQGLVLVAARALTAFRGSSNPTWLREGGLWASESIRGDVLSFAESIGEAIGRGAERRPSVEARVADAVEEGTAQTVELVVTSPPYANRLDYRRLWLPELAIAPTVGVPDIQGVMIGSTSIEGWRDEPPDMIERLPAETRTTLEEIRSSPHYASATYYYPFFLRYALGIHQAFLNIAGRVVSGGRVVVFVNDTVRKETLFRTSSLIRDTLLGCGFEVLGQQVGTVSRHVGSLQPYPRTSPLGTKQRTTALVTRAP